MEISIRDAIKKLEDNYVPSIVQKHCRSVAKVATMISHEYEKNNLITKEDQIQIIISSILHDLMRPIEFRDLDKYVGTKEQKEFWNNKIELYENKNHEDAAYEELKDDYPEIANTIKKHAFFDIDNLENLKQKIVYYADKRDEIGVLMNASDRMINAHLRHKYKCKTTENWVKVIETDKKILDLESEIFSKINIKPHECNELNDVSFKQLLIEYNIDMNYKVKG
jgi:HD superfamily phosphohydrolase YqeK